MSCPHVLEFSSPQYRTALGHPREASHSGDHPMPWAAPRQQASFTGLGEVSLPAGDQETQQKRTCELCDAAIGMLLALELTEG